MNEKFREQFLGLKKLIVSNIQAIEDLIKQAKQLEDLVKIFSNSEGQKQKEKLESAIQDIHKSISNLIKSTDNLLTEYNNTLYML